MTNITEEDLRANRHLQSLTKWGHVMFCVSNADHYLNQMETLRAEFTMDSILEIDGLVLAFAVTYGRLFSDAANGFPKLERNKVYKDPTMRNTHDRIIELRNTRYAHEGGSDDIQFALEVELTEDRLKLKPEIAFLIPGHEFPDYRLLINALQNYTYEKIHGTIEKCSKELSLKVEFPQGPPPAHHLKTKPRLERQPYPSYRAVRARGCGNDTCAGLADPGAAVSGPSRRPPRSQYPSTRDRVAW